MIDSRAIETFRSVLRMRPSAVYWFMDWDTKYHPRVCVMRAGDGVPRRISGLELWHYKNWPQPWTWPADSEPFVNAR